VFCRKEISASAGFEAEAETRTYQISATADKII